MDNLPEAEDAPVAVCNGVRLMLKVEIDKAAETARLSKEAEKLQKALDKLNAKTLRNPVIPKKPRRSLVEKGQRPALVGIGRQKWRKVQNSVGEVERVVLFGCKRQPENCGIGFRLPYFNPAGESKNV